MLAFQAYSSKKEKESEEHEEQQSGGRRSALRKRLASYEVAVGTRDEFESAISEIEKAFRKHGISDFISTLTPGAQNAIYAASFIWGYENAIKQVKNAMKLEQVKNASDEAERSRAVIESMEKQQAALSSHEEEKKTTSFVWSFYNEDMKEHEAHAAKSDSITEKPHKKEQQRLEAPHSAQEAVIVSIAGKNCNIKPALAYCAAAEQEAERLQEAEVVEKKREELARLVSLPAEKQKAEEGEREEEAAVKEKERVDEEQRKAKEEKEEEKTEASAKQEKEVQAEEKEREQQRERIAQQIRLQAEAVQEYAVRLSEECVRVALQRKEELLEEYARVEKQLRLAIEKLDRMAEEEKLALKKFCESLPAELASIILKRERHFSKRHILRKQLVKWLAHCRKARQQLLTMPLGKLIKMISLSSLFR